MQTSLEALLNGMEYRRLFEHETQCIQKQYKLCKIDIYILSYLDQAKEKNTPRDILASQMFTRGHISQSIKRLSNLNFIRTLPDEKDRRVFHCILTKKAEKVLIQVKDVMNELEEQLFKSVTQEEKALFLNLAYRINRNMVNELVRGN